MATYTAITDAETGHKSPLTISLARRLRDNPLAISEGAAGAPKIKNKAIDNLNLGGVSWSGSGFAGWTGIGDVLRMMILAGEVGSPGQTMRFQFTSDGGATWGSAQTSSIDAAQASGIGTGVIINLVTGVFESFGRSRQTGTLTVPANCDGVRISWVTSSGNAQAIAISGR